jgi:hypothetical protein
MILLRTAALACGSLSLLVGCSPTDLPLPSPGEGTVASVTMAADDGPGLVECQEPEPPPPGPCTIQVILERVHVNDGQGVSEGDLELEVDASTDGGAVTSYPSSGGSTTVEKEHGKTIGTLVSEYQLTPPDTQIIEVCSEVKEVDGGGANGQSDVASGCTSVLIGCHRPPEIVEIHEPLCRGNKTPCKANGSVTTTFRVAHSDEDGDGVEYLEDFAPTSCSDDASVLGQKGRAVLVYFHVEDPYNHDLAYINDMSFDSGVSLDEAMAGYDYKSLLVEDPFPYVGNSASGAYYVLSPQAAIEADYNGEPTVEGFFDALRDIVSKGYDVDIFVVGDGEQFGFGPTLDARFAAQDGTISGADISWRLHPLRSGARKMPIRLVYDTASFTDLHVPRWITLGAKAATGPKQRNFFPANQGSVSLKWNNGSTASDATAGIDWMVEYDSELRVAHIGIDDLGTLPISNLGISCWEVTEPGCYGCDDPPVVDEMPTANVCHWDAFLGQLPFHIPAYDAALTPHQNILESSYHFRGGNGFVTKWAAGLVW